MSVKNCSIFTPQMPIPPPTSDFIIKSKECRYSDRDKLPPKLPVNCQWAIEYPEIQKACILSHVCLSVKPKHFRMKLDVQPIIQEGPTCGMAALAMLTGNRPSVADILTLAKGKHFTNHGEMFSANNMQKLVVSILENLQYKSVKARIYSGELNCDQVKEELTNGACILVAYDSDFNHAPCLKKGHKAHWALIIGYLVDDKNRFFVFVRHGKTRNLALWSLESLSKSNSNLNEYRAPQRYDEYSFKMPIDGIAGLNGLKNQCVIITGISNLGDLIR